MQPWDIWYFLAGIARRSRNEVNILQRSQHFIAMSTFHHSVKWKDFNHLITVLIFAHGCDVTSMSLVGSLMALTHSILINLFIKVEFNNFSPTSPAKYCFCPKHFLAYVWLVYQGTREFCATRWWNSSRRSKSRSKIVFSPICIQEFFHGLKIVKLLRWGTLAATNRRRNPESPGKSDMNEAMIYIAYRQQAGGGMTWMPHHLEAKVHVSLFFFFKNMLQEHFWVLVI